MWLILSYLQHNENKQVIFFPIEAKNINISDLIILNNNSSILFDTRIHKNNLFMYSFYNSTNHYI